MRSETEEWLRASERWLKSVETTQIRTALQLRRHVPINRVYMVAIGKKFAHFLAPLAANEDFAYSNWTQFYDSVVRLSSAAGRKTLAALFSLLRTYMTHKVAIPQRIDEEITFHLDTLSFQIVQRHH